MLRNLFNRSDKKDKLKQLDEEIKALDDTRKKIMLFNSGNFMDAWSIMETALKAYRSEITAGVAASARGGAAFNADFLLGSTSVIDELLEFPERIRDGNKNNLIRAIEAKEAEKESIKEEDLLETPET
jgi:hypothetical protein